MRRCANASQVEMASKHSQEGAPGWWGREGVMQRSCGHGEEVIILTSFNTIMKVGNYMEKFKL